MRSAAFLTLPLLVASLTLGYLYFHAPVEDGVKYAEVTATMGAVVRYELPDRSVVWLNAGSTLRYPTVFRKESRNVELCEHGGRTERICIRNEVQCGSIRRGQLYRCGIGNRKSECNHP